VSAPDGFPSQEPLAPRRDDPGEKETGRRVHNILWRYASAGGRLLDSRSSPEEVRAITRDYSFGPVFYFAAFLLAFLSVPASPGLCLGLAAFFAITGSTRRTS
jgi:hypothetical protein